MNNEKKVITVYMNNIELFLFYIKRLSKELHALSLVKMFYKYGYYERSILFRISYYCYSNEINLQTLVKDPQFFIYPKIGVIK